jgi:hypothetical protein
MGKSQKLTPRQIASFRRMLKKSLLLKPKWYQIPFFDSTATMLARAEYECATVFLRELDKYEEKQRQKKEKKHVRRS